MALKTGISGLRGTVHPGEDSLTPTAVVQWVQAWVAYLHETRGARPIVALGRDGRRSSPALEALARGTLLAAGADVVALGLTLTPTVQHAVRRDERLDGGLMITASHNPLPWNGLKFLDHGGLFLSAPAWAFMAERVAVGALPTVPLDAVGQVVAEAGEAAWGAHLQAVLSALPTAEIRARHFRVALDGCNGGAARWAELLVALGCEVVPLHTEQHGFFAREAEPLPAHIGALRDLVRNARCDLGLAADPDGDRLVLVDARGQPVSEEHTVVLAAMAWAQKPGDTVVVNVVTTHALEGAVPHARVVRTAVGEMNVVAGVLVHAAVLGGEGSGGIIVPRMNLARDGMAAAGLILAGMAKEGLPLHEWLTHIPRWETFKAKTTATVGTPDALRTLLGRWQQEAPEVSFNGPILHIGSADGALQLHSRDGRLTLSVDLPGGERFKAAGSDEGLEPLFHAVVGGGTALTLDLTDGVKVQSKDVWLSLRTSNTEPIVRVMGERRM